MASGPPGKVLPSRQVPASVMKMMAPRAAKPRPSASTEKAEPPNGPEDNAKKRSMGLNDNAHLTVINLNSNVRDIAKKPRATADSLYSFLPEADPEKDRSAVSRAKELDIFSDPPATENPSIAIFLDIDGVLLRMEGCPTINLDGELLPLLHARGRAFAPEAVRALKFIVHRTGGSAVLSSEWRRHSTLQEEVATTIRAMGLPLMRGATAVLQAREDIAVGAFSSLDKDATLRLRWAERRAREISLWLREHPEVDRWVALDDLDLRMADEVKLTETFRMGAGLILCDPELGLTLSNARVAVEQLLRKK